MTSSWVVEVSLSTADCASSGSAMWASHSPPSRGYKFLTVVVNHDTRRLLWIAEGRSKSVLAAFFTELGPETRTWTCRCGPGVPSGRILVPSTCTHGTLS